MVLPRLLHPVTIIVETKDASRTITDSRSRSVVGQPLRKRVSFKGQLSNKRHDQIGMNPGGRETGGEGYILVRLVDLERAGIEVDIGDKIIKMGRRDVKYYVTRLEYKAGYSDQDGHSLVRFFYNDRSPVK